MQNSIKGRFIFFVIILTMISVGFPTYFLLKQFRNNFQQRSDIMLQTTLNVVKNGLNTMMLSGEDKDIQGMLQSLSENKNIDHIRIFDSSGVILYDTSPELRGKNIEAIDPIHSSLNKNKLYFQRARNRMSYSTSQPIFNKPACQSCHSSQKKIIAYLDIDTDLTEAEAYFYTGYRHTLLLALVTMIILIGGFYFMFRKLIEHPLNKFTVALEEVEHGNFNTFLPASHYKELHQMEQHFNNMVVQIKKSRDQIEDLHFNQLQHADKLVTLGELAAEMAHEINNPIAISLSRIDYLQMETEDNPKLLAYGEDIKVISDQLIRVSQITKNILKYSRKAPHDFHQMSLADLVDSSVKMLQPRLKKHNITLIQDYVCDAHCEKAFIMGDPQQVEQLIINLVNNAVDSIGKDGEIKIHIKCQKDGTVRLSVSDSGAGIPAEIQQSIFSPFFSTKTNGKGTGLGLYIVKKICDRHQAKISCQSSPGNGAVFAITFNEAESV